MEGIHLYGMHAFSGKHDVVRTKLRIKNNNERWKENMIMQSGKSLLRRKILSSTYLGSFLTGLIKLT